MSTSEGVCIIEGAPRSGKTQKLAELVVQKAVAAARDDPNDDGQDPQPKQWTVLCIGFPTLAADELMSRVEGLLETTLDDQSERILVQGGTVPEICVMLLNAYNDTRRNVTNREKKSSLCLEADFMSLIEQLFSQCDNEDPHSPVSTCIGSVAPDVWRTTLVLAKVCKRSGFTAKSVRRLIDAYTVSLYNKGTAYTTRYDDNQRDAGETLYRALTGMLYTCHYVEAFEATAMSSLCISFGTTQQCTTFFERTIVAIDDYHKLSNIEQHFIRELTSQKCLMGKIFVTINSRTFPSIASLFNFRDGIDSRHEVTTAEALSRQTQASRQVTLSYSGQRSPSDRIISLDRQVASSGTPQPRKINRTKQLCASLMSTRPDRAAFLKHGPSAAYLSSWRNSTEQVRYLTDVCGDVIESALEAESTQEIAILVRRRSHVDNYVEALSGCGIEVSAPGQAASEMNDNLVRAALCILLAAADPGKDGIRCCLAKGMLDLTVLPVGATRELADGIQREATLFENGVIASTSRTHLSPRHRALAKLIKVTIQADEMSVPIAVMLRDIFRNECFTSITAPKTRKNGIYTDALLRRAEAFDKRPRRHHYTRSRLEHFVCICAAYDPIWLRSCPGRPSVAILTMHIAQGLSFDTVLIPDADEGHFPEPCSSEAEVPTEKALFATSMLRADGSLYMSYVVKPNTVPDYDDEHIIEWIDTPSKRTSTFDTRRHTRQGLGPFLVSAISQEINNPLRHEPAQKA